MLFRSALFNTELLKQNDAHHRELVKAKGDREVGLGLSQAEVIAIKTECEGLKAKLEMEEEEKLKMNGMIISYAELVKIMQGKLVALLGVELASLL